MNIFTKLAALFTPVVAPVAVSDTVDLPQMIYVQDKTSHVNFSALKDLGITTLNLSYFDFSGAIPDQKTVDWNNALEDLWNQKLSIKNVSNATRTSADDVLSGFQTADSEQMSINVHIDQLDILLTDVKSKINWDAVCADYKLNAKQCYNFVYTAYNIDASMLTAYSMTELMPYQHGERNYELMSLYFQNAGRRFLDAVPALGDTYLSMGRYQFTSYAIGSDKDGPRPANKIAAYASYEIPGSVVKLYGNDSDVAAYYFSIFNLLTLIRKMDDKQIDAYANSCRSKKGQIVEYIATAHHNPSWARKRALQWVNGKCTKPLIEYQGDRLKTYSIKTSTNYKAIILHRDV